ncbi:hypothetical protein BBD41_03235 [Paenibacillus ihbetae]|uniref:Uncharacterized protein n=1 Tax=Paenibacillus ihbetae TaxID=1870820 RepID=A0A1B2DVD7_9BACL|nr:hypothetical protein [Paenibacillus ihbetae]ANY71673.1 hypothetical protein BBD41_03235 [Paenibacillus ihbetae]
MSRDWQLDMERCKDFTSMESKSVYIKALEYWLQQYAATKEELAKINCDYYADKQRFVVQRRELEESKAREKKLRSAIQTVLEMESLNIEQMENDPKGVYNAAMWFLSGIMDSLYPKEETNPAVLEDINLPGEETTE